MLISRDYKNRLLAVGEDGGSTRQAITKAQLQEFEVEFPPLAEQQRIVGLLDAAFAGLATAQARAAKNLQSVFTQSGSGWIEKPLADICTFINGRAYKKTRCSALGNIHSFGSATFSQTGIGIIPTSNWTRTNTATPAICSTHGQRLSARESGTEER
jgi:restriction endonuclease S subunit